MEKLTPSSSGREHRRRQFRRFLTIALIVLASALGENLVRRATAVSPPPDSAQDSKPGKGAGSDGGAGSPWRGMLESWEPLGEQYSGDRHFKHGPEPPGGAAAGIDHPHGNALAFGKGPAGVSDGFGPGTDGGPGGPLRGPGFGPGAGAPSGFTPDGFAGGPDGPGGAGGAGGPGGAGGGPGGGSGGGPGDKEGQQRALADNDLLETGSERAAVPEPDVSITVTVALGLLLIVRRMIAATQPVRSRRLSRSLTHATLNP